MNTQRMSCTEAREKLPLYVGGDLERETQDTLRSHLERCAECHRMVQNAVQARRELVLALRERSQGPRPALWGDVRAKLVAEGRLLEDAAGRPLRPADSLVTPARTARRLQWTRALVPLAAAAVVLLVVQLSGVLPELARDKNVRPGPTPREGGNLVVVPTPAPLEGGLIQVDASEAVNVPTAFRNTRGARPLSSENGVALTSYQSTDWK